MKKQPLKCLQKNLDHTAQGHQFHQKWKMIWKGEVLLLWKEKHFCIGNTQTFNRPSGSKTLVSSVLCIIKLRIVLFMFCLWCRATVHNQNRSVGQGHFNTSGQWLWSNHYFLTWQIIFFDITDRTVASLWAQSLFHRYFYQTSAGGNTSNA